MKIAALVLVVAVVFVACVVSLAKGWGDAEGELVDARVKYDALAAEHVALQTDLAGLREAHAAALGTLDTAVRERDASRAAMARLDARRTELEADLSGLQQSHAAALSALDTVRMQLEELQTEAGGLEELRESAERIRREIDGLRARREPLILKPRDTRPVRFLCSGSMEPAITCLDEGRLLLAFKPEDIVVGAVISFAPYCTGDSSASHRVVSVKVEDGIHYYRTQGDANPKPDNCWVPHTDVRGYLISLRKNVVMQNAELRNGFNAAKTAFHQSVDNYLRLVEEVCGRRTTENCDYGGRLDEVLADHARHRKAFAYYECWARNVRAADNSGRIIHDCEGEDDGS